MYLLLVLVTIVVGARSGYVPGNGDNVSLQTLLQRIELMEVRHATAIESMESKHASAIESMASKHTEEIQTLSVKHEDDIQSLTARVENCERATSSVADNLSPTEGANSSKVTTNLQGQIRDQATYMPRRRSDQDKKIHTPMRRLYDDNEDTHIAFSAYLDHDLNGVGTDQVIVMNQVLLNDGNGYSKNLGAFTAPIDGVYSFSFFIADRDTNQMFARLTVNSVPEVDGIVDTIHHSQDAQGGNTVNLKLSAGDAVMLKHTRKFFVDSDHLEGSDVARLSTFSGFLLYPIEPQSVSIVGK